MFVTRRETPLRLTPGLAQQPAAEDSYPKRGSEPKPDERSDISQLVDEGVRPFVRETGKPPTDQEAKQGYGDGDEDDVGQRQHRACSVRGREVALVDGSLE